MPIKIGTSSFSKGYVGTSEIQKVYLGTSLVYEKASDFNPNMYDNGVENTSFVLGYISGTYTFSENATYCYMSGGGYNLVNTGTATYVTDVAIDLTNYTTLTIVFDVPAITGSSQAVYLVASTDKTGNYTTYDGRTQALLSVVETDRTATLNVSALNGSYYIRVHHADVSSSGRSYIHLKEVYLT